MSLCKINTVELSFPIADSLLAWFKLPSLRKNAVNMFERLLVLGFCLLGLNLRAASGGTEGVVPLIEAKGQTSGKSTDSVIWGVSGSKLPIELDLVAPLGSSGALICGIFQASEELAARLPGGGELISDLSFSDRTFQRLEVQVPMPEVERETTLFVLFSLKSKPDGKVLASTKVSVRLVPGPESPLNPVTRLKKLPEGSLLVTGESPRIRRFLDKMNIFYVDGLAVSSGVPAVVLSEGNEMPANIPGGLPVILFCKSDRQLPGVYAASRTGAERIKVTLAVLDSIATDVLAQRTFADLIFSALPTQPKTEP